MKYNNQSDKGLNVEEGEICEETYLTNYMTFGQLLKKFNEAVPEDFKINDGGTILRFRDSMAHGRMITFNGTPVTVYKYSQPKPKSSVVKLEIKQQLSEDYLKQIEWKLNYTVIVTRKALSLLNKSLRPNQALKLTE